MAGVVKKGRTSKTQYGLYVDYIEKHDCLRTGKLSPTTTPEYVNNLWIELKDKLNACGDGPIRDIDGWKKVFTEWKSQIRKKGRENKPLNSLEERLLKATGVIVVYGNPAVPELGVDEVAQVVQSVEGVVIEYVDDAITKEDFENIPPRVAVCSSENVDQPHIQQKEKIVWKKKKKCSSTLLELYQRDQIMQRNELANI